MTDPYKVLGVSPNASDDEIKAAYRQLAKKYHPDNYANNPLADLAEEKMREINEAYDMIQSMRVSRGNGGGNSSSAGYNSYNNSYNAGEFGDIRRLINLNKIIEADEARWRAFPQSGRDAEWHYLKGVIHYKRGWLEEAMKHFQTANRMDPNNMGVYSGAQSDDVAAPECPSGRRVPHLHLTAEIPAAAPVTSAPP